MFKNTCVQKCIVFCSYLNFALCDDFAVDMKVLSSQNRGKAGDAQS